LAGHDNGSVADALTHAGPFPLIDLVIQSVRQRPRAHTIVHAVSNREDPKRGSAIQLKTLARSTFHSVLVELLRKCHRVDLPGAALTEFASLSISFREGV
jgi:hypothetical protein